MASRPPLAVWLYGEQVATLSEPQYGKLRMDFTEAGEYRFGAGSTVLSLSLPLDVARRPNANIVRAFLNGLLPEGGARAKIAARFDVRAEDVFGLVSAIGRDCAGAVVFQPVDERAHEGVGYLEPIDNEALARLVRGIKDRPLGADEKYRTSLAGMQDKLLLAKDLEGNWAIPRDGAPSTHILKPQDMRLEASAAGEAFCLQLARRLGLTTVDAEVLDVDGRPVVAISRYDRLVPDNKAVERVHQEDSCQAIAIDCYPKSERKYEAYGGPTLRQIALLLRDHARLDDIEKLLAITTFNIVVGNADAHGKNTSFLHFRDGATLAIAPIYDVSPTTFYREIMTSEGFREVSDELSMAVNGERNIHEIATSDLVAEAVSWGVPQRRANEIVHTTLERTIEVFDEAWEAAPVPEAMTSFIIDRHEALYHGHPAQSYDATGTAFEDIRHLGDLRAIRRPKEAKATLCGAPCEENHACTHPIGPLGRCPVHGPRPKQRRGDNSLPASGVVRSLPRGRQVAVDGLGGPSATKGLPQAALRVSSASRSNQPGAERENGPPL